MNPGAVPSSKAGNREVKCLAQGYCLKSLLKFGHSYPGGFGVPTTLCASITDAKALVPQ